MANSNTMLNEKEAGELLGVLPGRIARWVRSKILDGVTTSTGVLTSTRACKTFAAVHARELKQGRYDRLVFEAKRDQLSLDLGWPKNGTGAE